MAEGMACAKPIVHPDYTTPYELLIDESMGIGPRGWVVPIQALNTSSFNTEHAFVDQDKYVEILKEVVKNPREMSARGQNGRVFAERHLNWEYLVEDWKNLILKIC